MKPRWGLVAKGGSELAMRLVQNDDIAALLYFLLIL